jgi:protein involved in sex pheromone biosynthesis
MVCSKKRKIGIFFISIVILLIACNHFGKQDNEKSSQFSNSSIDSVRNLVELGDTLNNNNKIFFQMGALQLPKS